MTHNLTVFLHDKVKFRDKGRVCAEGVQDIVLQTSGTVDIPECLAGQVFHGTVVGRGFVANDNVLHDDSS